jgi:hypothetical protein
MAIHDGFPQVDLEWLLYGKGNTFGETSAPSQDNSIDYPLFSGNESALFRPNTRDNSDFSNLNEVKTPVQSRKRLNNKDVSDKSNTPANDHQKRIKEVVVFFEDGTYQNFLPDLKK